MAVNWKNGSQITILLHDVIVKLFWWRFISLVKFSYWSKFHVNTITGSGVMTISFYKSLTRNPEIGNTCVCLLPNIGRLGRVTNTKFSTNFSSKMLPNTAKCQGYSFCCSWVIIGKPTGEVKYPTQVRVKNNKQTKKQLIKFFDHILRHVKSFFVSIIWTSVYLNLVESWYIMSALLIIIHCCLAMVSHTCNRTCAHVTCYPKLHCGWEKCVCILCTV